MTPFTIDNLPYGVISSPDNPRRRCAVAFEESAIDLDQLQRDGFFSSIELVEDLFRNSWNAFAALPADTRAAVRGLVRQGILGGNKIVNGATLPLAGVQNHLPMDVRNFSDFYCSLEHATNCSAIMGLKGTPANWAVIPSVYNGRTSSLAVSGTPVTRPCGVFPDPADPTRPPRFQPEPHLDFELEMGVWLEGPAVARGQRLALADAADQIFGLTLLNDWSARRIQMFEMPPLGPFHAKGSATTVSPWIVPVEALAPFRCARAVSPQEPPPPPHLACEEATQTWDIALTARLVRDGGPVYTLCETNLNELHWTPLQQLAHLASAGEGLSPGDVFGTGTISSPRTNAAGEKVGLGCLFERQLPGAGLRSLPADLLDVYVRDGDEIVLEGWCIDRATGRAVLGFGEARAKVLPAVLPAE